MNKTPPLHHTFAKEAFILSTYYPVHYSGNSVGQLMFRDEGLYYKYNGDFQLKEDGIYRVYGITPSLQINLGVCNPYDDLWCIRGKIAKNKLDLSKTHFIIRSTNDFGKFVPLIENESFAYLDRLEQCRLVCNGNLTGLLFAEKVPCSLEELHEDNNQQFLHN